MDEGWRGRERDEGEGRGTGKGRRQRDGSGLFRGGKSFGESNLLPVIHGLLTTTGCGHSPRRPQPMGVPQISVNEFMVRKTLIFSSVLTCAKHPEQGVPSGTDHARFDV